MSKSSKQLLTDAVGWYGSVAIMFAYVLVTFDVVSPNGVYFQLLNATGAIGLITVSLQKKAPSIVTLNVFWLAIALIGLIRIYL